MSALLEPELASEDGTPWEGEPEPGQLGILEERCNGQHWMLRHWQGSCNCGAVL
jgi:hypothetical protein